MAEKLYPYQEYGAKFLAERETALLADAPGVGKTAQFIVAADQIQAVKILVLTPGVARENWRREFLKFSKYKRSVGIIESSKKGVPDTEVLIASYSIIRSRPILEKLLSMKFDLLGCDEAHFLKSTKAVVTQCVYGKKFDRSKGLSSVSKRVWLLTGSPIPNNLSEMFSHSRALFPEVCTGLERFGMWKDYFCVTDSFGGRVIANKNINEFIRRIKPYTLRRRLEDVLPDLPPIRITQVVVVPEKLPPKTDMDREAEAIIQGAIAQQVMKTGSIENLSEDDLKAIEKVAGMHIATNRKWCGIAKAHAVAEIVNNDFESGLDKIVIFAQHREVFEILLKEIPGSAAIHGGVKQDERNKLIDRFQGLYPDEPLHKLILHTNIASTALTLTASNNVLYAEQDWVPTTILQAAKRCHRFGQTRPVLGRIISLRDSIDEVIGYTLARKSQSISKIEKALTTEDGI
ncbi:MAG: DEAD/DEAH box helicase [Rhodospirillales bacterium]|nr:DEAD/DEAH box helicase [Rhodospirillales bacterium]